MKKLWHTAAEYNALQEKFDASQAEVARLQQELDAAKAASQEGPTSEEVQTQMEALNSQVSALTAERDNLKTQVETLKKGSPGPSRTTKQAEPEQPETSGSSFLDPETSAVYGAAQSLFNIINLKQS